MATVEKDQYESLAATYNAIEALSQSPLYQELVINALGDCNGKHGLDLGGGCGLHASNAVDKGAKVDVVDIASAMLEAGKVIQNKASRNDGLRWFVGDITKPLIDLPLEKEYDFVMVNWTFDHAETVDELESMWKNTADYTKKGGKLVSVRMADPNAKAGQVGKYGVSFSDVEEIPGGLRYVYTAHTTPSFSCAATTMSESLDFEKAKLMARRYGFDNFKKIDPAETSVVKNDPEFWKVFLEDPHFICIEATKVE